MRLLTKLVLFGSIAVASALVAGYFLNTYVPGLASSLTQSLSIIILSIGIASSSIAVLSGRSLEEYYKKQNEERRVKSALVSYLSGLVFQFADLSSLFYGISTTEFPPIPRVYPKEIQTGIAQEIDLFIQVYTKSLVGSRSRIDNSFYEKNIKDQLLYLSPGLAHRALFVATLVWGLNLYYDSLAESVSNELRLAKGYLPTGYVISTYFQTHKAGYKLASDLASYGRQLVQNLTSDILLNQKPPLQPLQSLQDKMQEAKVAMDKADQDFVQTLFPTRQPPSSSTFPSSA